MFSSTNQWFSGSASSSRVVERPHGDLSTPCLGGQGRQRTARRSWIKFSFSGDFVGHLWLETRQILQFLEQIIHRSWIKFSQIEVLLLPRTVVRPTHRPAPIRNVASEETWSVALFEMIVDSLLMMLVLCYYLLVYISIICI